MAADQVPAESAAQSVYVVWTTRLVTALAVAMSLFHLYIAYFGPPNAFTLRSAHLGMALVLVYLSMPGILKPSRGGPAFPDWVRAGAPLPAAPYPQTSHHYFNPPLPSRGRATRTTLSSACSLT